MKVAITFIGTNKYLDFLPRYYENIKEYFLPDTEKIFLVFTDGDGDFPDDVKVFSYLISYIFTVFFCLKKSLY